ncbi:unnamed protein product [Lampetra planeri]
MPATDEDDLSSLKVARCLEVHFNIQRRANMAACARPSEDGGQPEDGANLQVCASFPADVAHTGAADMRDHTLGLTNAEWGRLQPGRSCEESQPCQWPSYDRSQPRYVKSLTRSAMSVLTVVSVSGGPTPKFRTLAFCRETSPAVLPVTIMITQDPFPCVDYCRGVLGLGSERGLNGAAVPVDRTHYPQNGARSSHLQQLQRLSAGFVSCCCCSCSCCSGSSSNGGLSVAIG